ncbi:hypothetical protein JF50_13265 [Pseudoalteromonas luteoviolacea]|uniref:YecR-like lipoprotein n=1 Tax=Pseudoalteromonas luteoviolacea TaxID=43657 RepID=A0A0C1Q805_9GAMM|nr:YecR family lipoprotein [Pseudoalteromonas luteoviolacea]KID56861.1 hypothetical protein JF50_13265 [Pseudoalteromonas luteoviolacea]
MKKALMVSLVALFATGCMSTQKDWSATGGSKSDGTVKLSYQYGLFESPTVNEEQAIRLASKRCQAWGYSSAEAFGGITKNCNSPSANGCNSWLVTKEYQCTGQQ